MIYHMSLASDPMRAYGRFSFFDGQAPGDSFEGPMHFDIIPENTSDEDLPYISLNVPVFVRKDTNAHGTDLQILVFNNLEDIRYFIVNAKHSKIGEPYNVRIDKLEMYGDYPGGFKLFVEKYKKLPRDEGVSENRNENVDTAWKRVRPDMSFADDW